MNGPPSEAALVRAVTVVRIASFASLAIYLAVVQMLPAPATQFAPRWFSIAALASVIVLALAAVVLRSIAQASRTTPKRRLRAGLAVYAVSDLLGVVALLIWAFEGDVRQATGCILGAAIFAAGGMRERRTAGDRR